MTRINTNVSSLVAQTVLQRSNADLQQSLNRLSTGLRINTGKDDPAGLIASENLRSDIVSVGKAVSNSERANQIIATAESGLGEVSSLLNDIRGLVTEAANSGALSDEQIAANQLQLDSSLESLNRIAQVTSFQGQRLLDGSLDFVHDALAQTGVSSVQIDQANLGTSGSLAVDIDISSAAAQASVNTDIDATTGAVKASLNADLSVFGGTTTGSFTITAATAGTSMNGIAVSVAESASIDPGKALAVYDSDASTITVYVSDANTAGGGDTSVATISAAVNALSDFSTSGEVAGNGLIGDDTPGALGTTSGGVDGGTGLLADVVFELSGSRGSEVFSFESGTLIAQVEAAVDLVSDATGVQANVAGNTITFQSTGYGSDALVNIVVLSEGAGGVFESGFSGTTRDTGSDVVATVNGVSANADGNKLSINTSALDMSLTVTDGSSTDINFTITGGGALFQLGPDVVSNQQARLGIQSVNTSRLGGSSGELFRLGSGGTAALNTDPTTAALIVGEAIDQITSLRGRLGAFQKTTLDTNISSLNETLVNLTEAESTIRDADFAAETAALTRAQILVQSGTSVLSIANSNPQNVLALLR